MKKRFLAFSALMMALAASLAAQDKMVVWKGSESIIYNVADVDSVTFVVSNQPEENPGNSSGDDQIPDADKNAMPSNAKQLAAKMYAGINIGNTLEAVGSWCEDEETCWGAAKVTQGLLDAYKKAGFNAVRIPVAWHSHESNPQIYEIDPAWMARIKEVVDFAMNDELYVILNIHWDNGWLEKNCTKNMQESVNREQAALWKQIALTFREYDEHLLFASANEPDANNAEEASVLKSYHQTFVNTVRETGGNNALRNLIVQAPSTAIDKAIEYDVMPTDVVEDRMMMEVHFYPYTYSLMEEDADWGNAHYFWGKQYDNIYINGVNRSVGANGWCNEAYVDGEFAKMKNKYVNKGIPVILGEYAVMNRDVTAAGKQQTFEESRAYYYEYVNRTAKNNGIVPFLWETPGNIFNRDKNSNQDNSVINPTALDGIMKGARSGKYPY